MIMLMMMIIMPRVQRVFFVALHRHLGMYSHLVRQEREDRGGHNNYDNQQLLEMAAGGATVLV